MNLLRAKCYALTVLVVTPLRFFALHRRGLGALYAEYCNVVKIVDVLVLLGGWLATQVDPGDFTILNARRVQWVYAFNTGVQLA